MILMIDFKEIISYEVTNQWDDKRLLFRGDLFVYMTREFFRLSFPEYNQYN